jgi:hypothetical protein
MQDRGLGEFDEFGGDGEGGLRGFERQRFGGGRE